MKIFNPEDTICAITTGGGMSAIAVIRISGKHAISISNSVFSKNINNFKSHTIHFGNITDQKRIIDEVLLSIFKDNNSFTGEESVEISCHGSIYIQKKIIQLLIKKGCRMASPGEFTMRAFKNGKLDLSQAESISDLISSESSREHQTALQNLKGGFSSDLQELRKQLINFASLVELELDFSEEDVEFANREEFENLLKLIKSKIENLIDSFKLGNVIKQGISVAILGAPNVGKSTLLNCLLNEERAIVSNIAGTTRDAIEDEMNIDGYKFRFIDTAGIRETSDTIENLGINKTLDKAENSNINLYVLDANTDISNQLIELDKLEDKIKEKTLIVVNKIDLKSITQKKLDNAIYISAKDNKGIKTLKKKLLTYIDTKKLSNNETIITNLRQLSISCD